MIDGDLGADKLSGGPGNDQIDGGSDVLNYRGETTRYPADDTIDGGPGNDSIDGHRGNDRLAGGDGDDTIRSEDFAGHNWSPLIPLAGGDRVSCGRGNDLGVGDYYDELGLDCEVVDEGTHIWRAVRPKRGKVLLKARCAWRANAPCRGAMRLVWTARRLAPAALPPYLLQHTQTLRPVTGCRHAARDRLVGSGHFRLRSGRVNRVTLGLAPASKRLLAKAGCMLVRVQFRFRQPGGPTHEMTRTLSLRGRLR